MPSDSVYLEQQTPTHFKRTWTAFRQNTLALFGLWCLSILMLLTILSPWISPFAAEHQSDLILLPPSWNAAGSIEYFLGTDDLSRDILSRLIISAKASFGYAILIAFAAGIIGIFIGVLAGVTQGFTSSFLNHLLDTILSIPSLLLAIIFVTFYGEGELSILLAVWLGLIPRFVRSVYTAVHAEMKKEYILATRLDGANTFYILYHAILPNILTTLTGEFTRAISLAILDIAALGFLGLTGSATPQWGSMMIDSIDLIFTSPWTVALPGVTITFSVLIVNLVGNGISQAINVGTE